jgi:hypothetical protein
MNSKCSYDAPSTFHCASRKSCKPTMRFPVHCTILELYPLYSCTVYCGRIRGSANTETVSTAVTKGRMQCTRTHASMHMYRHTSTYTHVRTLTNTQSLKARAVYVHNAPRVHARQYVKDKRHLPHLTQASKGTAYTPLYVVVWYEIWNGNCLRD